MKTNMRIWIALLLVGVMGLIPVMAMAWYDASNIIQDVTNKVNPPKLTIPDNVINGIQIQPPLSEEEWRKQLRRKRLGL